MIDPDRFQPTEAERRYEGITAACDLALTHLSDLDRLTDAELETERNIHAAEFWAKQRLEACRARRRERIKKAIARQKEPTT